MCDKSECRAARKSVTEVWQKMRPSYPMVIEMVDELLKNVQGKDCLGVIAEGSILLASSKLDPDMAAAISLELIWRDEQRRKTANIGAADRWWEQA